MLRYICIAWLYNLHFFLFLAVSLSAAQPHRKTASDYY
jgi:hypothetical protein